MANAGRLLQQQRRWRTITCKNPECNNTKETQDSRTATCSIRCKNRAAYLKRKEIAAQVAEWAERWDVEEQAE